MIVENTFETETQGDMGLSKEILELYKSLSDKERELLLLTLLEDKEKILRKASVLNYIKAVKESFNTKAK